MAFGKNFSLPIETMYNHSGEYVLCAVLNDKCSDNEGLITPVQVFEESGKYKPNGSDPTVSYYCLPSAIVSEAQKKKMVVKLYNSDIPATNNDLIQNEERSLKETNVPFEKKSISAILSDSKNKYCLILLQPGYWIAVKRKSNGRGFVIYDPKERMNKEFDSKDSVVKELKSSFTYGVTDNNTLVVAIE